MVVVVADCLLFLVLFRRPFLQDATNALGGVSAIVVAVFAAAAAAVVVVFGN